MTVELFTRAVCDENFHSAEGVQFTFPVDHYRRRAHHDNAPQIVGVQVRGKGDGLNGFAQTHLIAQDGFLLHHGEARAIGLIAAEEKIFDVGCIQLQRTDALESRGVVTLIYPLSLNSQQ